MFYSLDILYGKINFEAEDLKLFQSPELSRLRRVTLNSNSDWASLTSSCCSRFEHSLGVWHLAKIVGAKEGFSGIAKDLRFAALAHDLATPPFSHGSERAMKILIKKDHEEVVDEIIHDSEFGKIVKKQGGDLQIITDLIQQHHPFSDLINGTIDLDNLDNTLRFGVSTGLFRRKRYDPEKLADNFVINNGVFGLNYSDDLKKWENCRKEAYRYIYNIYPEFVIPRALDLAMEAGDLTKEYFRMDDHEANRFLKEKCNDKTKKIIERAEKWQLYPLVYGKTLLKPSKNQLKILSDLTASSHLAREISNQLKIAPEDIVIGIMKNKGYKKIHLPIFYSGRADDHKPNQQDVWYLHVYLFQNQNSLRREIAGIVDDFLGK